MKMFSRLLHAGAICVTAMLGVSTAKAAEYTASTEFTAADSVAGWTSVTGGTQDAPVVFSATDSTYGLTVSSGNMGLASGYWTLSSGTYNVYYNLYGTAGVLTFAGDYLGTQYHTYLYNATMNVTGGEFWTGRYKATNDTSANPYCGAIVVAPESDNNAAFNVSGGSVHSYGSGEDGIGWWYGLNIAAGANSTGSVTVSGTGAFTNANDTVIAGGSGSTGTLTIKDNGDYWNWTMAVGTAGTGSVYLQNSGNFYVNGTLTIGTAGAGVLNVSGGTMTVNGGMHVGNGAGSGSMTMTGGTLGVTGDFNLGIVGSTCSFTMSGDSVITATGAGWNGADNSKSTVAINGGSLTYAGNYNMLNAASRSDSYITTTVAGGTLTANEFWCLGSAGTATINLNSGTLATGLIGVNGKATYILNLAGGTLKAKTADATLLPASDYLTVNVTANSTLATDGKSITIAKALAGTGAITVTGSGAVTFTATPASTVTFNLQGGSVILPNDYAGSVTTDVSGYQVNTVVGDSTTTYAFGLAPASYTWKGSAGGSWSDTANWEGGIVPTAVDTAIFPDGASVVVDADATVAGITGNGALTLTGPTASKVTLTASSVTVAGDLTVADNVAVAATLDVTGALTVTQSNIAFGSYADNMTTVSVGSSNIANGFSGVGALDGNGTLTLATDSTASFTGVLSGNQNVVKTGSGTYTLIGNNTFAGNLTVSAGTLKLGTPQDIADIRMDFDASDTDSFTVDTETGYVTAWKDQVNGLYFNYEAGAHATVSDTCFGGKKSLLLNSTGEDGTTCSLYKLSEYNTDRRSKMLFVAYQSTVDSQPYAHLYSESKQDAFRIEIRGAGSNHYWYQKYNKVTEPFYMNGVRANTRVGTDPQLMAMVDTPFRNLAGGSGSNALVNEFLGASSSTATGFKGGIGEIISYNRNLTHAERKAVDAYLMSKWGIGTASYTPVPSTAAVTLGSGATLDLGGLTQTVKSVALSETGTATVQNGTLTITDAISLSSGQILKIPEGSTYTTASSAIQATTADGIVTLEYAVASYNGTNYATLQAALTAAADAINGGTATEATVTLLASVSEEVAIAAGGISLVLGECTVGSVVAASGIDLAYDENTKTYTSSFATAFTWTGASTTDATAWSDPANWDKNAVPGTDAEVTFPARSEGADPWSVVLSADATIATMTCNWDVQFSGGVKIYATQIDGDYTITMNNFGFSTLSGTALVINTDLEIAASTANYLYNNGEDVHVNGDLSGSGNLTGQSSGTYRGVKFYGSNSAFAGTFTAAGADARDATKFEDADASSANATWIISSTSQAYNQGGYLIPSSGTYNFGSFTGSTWLQFTQSKLPIESGVTINIGSLNKDDSFALSARGYCDVYKLGTGKMTISKTADKSGNYWNCSRYHLKDGVLAINNSAVHEGEKYIFEGGTMTYVDFTNADPSARIVNSTSAIVFDDKGNDCTWATALASSNTAGFTKKGDGTLTLSAVPAYTGATTVEAGALILPAGSTYKLGSGTVVDSSYTGEGIKLVPATSMMAMVGGVGYATLGDAITAATSGSTVTLLNNMWNTTPASDSNPLTETIVIEKDLTIDLGCHTLEANNVRAFWIKAGDVTITNGIVRVAAANATSLSTESSVIRLGDNTATGEAKLTIAADCDIITDYCYGVTVFGSATTETLVVNGTIEAKGINSAISGNGSTGYGDTTITINEGASVLTTQTVAIYQPQSGTLNVYGTVTGGIEAKAGTVNVYDGAEISALTGVSPGETTTNHNDGPSTIGYALAVADNASYAGGATLNVTGGVIGGGLVKVVDSTPQAECDIAVSGGTFTEAVPAQFCAAGYVPSAIDTTTQLYTVETGLMITEGSLLGKKLTITDTTFFPTECDTTAEQAVYLNTQQANGYYGWQNYVMNADGTTVLAPTYTASGTTITLAPSFGTARTGAGVGVAYKVQQKVGENWTDLSGNTYDTADMDAGTEQLFRIKATFSAE